MHHHWAITSALLLSSAVADENTRAYLMLFLFVNTDSSQVQLQIQVMYHQKQTYTSLSYGSNDDSGFFFLSLIVLHSQYNVT